MGIIDMIKKLGRKSPEEEDFERSQRMQERYFEKKKSANERELERFMREEREDEIKKELEEYRRNRKIKDMTSNKILKIKNVFKGHNAELLKNGNLMKNDKKLIRGGNLFYDQ